MKHALLAVAVLFGASGCSQRGAANPARLLGTHDLVLSGQLIFTTSTANNELRALDITSNDPVYRQFVPAPNPLEALSIPVLEHPSFLAHDTRYADILAEDGSVVAPRAVEATGSYVFAARSGGSEISIVAAAKNWLIEVKRLPLSAPVTAMAAVADPAGVFSRLYYATYDGEKSVLNVLELPADPAALAAMPMSELLAPPRARTVARFEAPLPDAVVVELLNIPGLAGRRLEGKAICDQPSSDCLVVATRTSSGKTGPTLLFQPDADPLKQAHAALHFPGPVRLLVTHGRVALGASILEAGQRVFALLDEEACGGPTCGGVMAVDTLTGEVATDWSGLPMLPIQIGDALPLGLALAPNALISLPASLAARPPAVLGAITSSLGSVFFFDAARLTHLDAEPLGPQPTEVTLHPVDGGIVEGAQLAATASFADGAWHSGSFSVAVNGALFGPQPTQDSDGGVVFPLPPPLAARVEVGDTLYYYAPGDPRCSAAVVAVYADAVRVAALQGPSCADRPTFVVAAGEAHPYVIASSEVGYLGRSAPGAHFSYRGTYFHRADEFDATRNALEMEFGVPNPALPSGVVATFDLIGNFVPYGVLVDSSAVGCSATLPGSALYATEQQKLYVVFPSGNGVVEIDPLYTAPGVMVQARAICYH